ncbi:MAG: 16S rRNA (guanine(966)-N(2))-methyltransferase RsmD [Neisseria sp.]|uniref:16S rRNA (guanine(966)-N(2))-methyltransferase RsmD n=1 Tax=Neisseria sp. TaxID=192066 RepID=UPI0026DBB13B|nr:16S rRNA (guanine(966)-N(2))-methyltransferase RsmD [Neisseria sp.]MDO4641404.1 16S rRNA (guanine(966)-N(2))-methyltransferase RsmD [Neisseria sp.]
MPTYQHSNQVRIIGGVCRGRKVNFASSEGLRPTADMVRERLFNWLGQDLTGLNVLDLFAGSGALGLEAASRNAANVVMVEKNRNAAHVLKRNIETLGLNNSVSVLMGDALSYLQNVDQQFDVVFLDPPFAWSDWPVLFTKLHQCLFEKAKVYIEVGNIPAFPEWLIDFREGKSGKSKFFLKEYHVI